MTLQGVRVGGMLGAAALLLLLLQGTHSQMHTTVEVMNDSCDAQLQSLWNNYTSPPVSPVAGCNQSCLAACYDTLNWAIYSEKKQDCPYQTDIIRCMHVRLNCRGEGAAKRGGGCAVPRRPRFWPGSRRLNVAPAGLSRPVDHIRERMRTV